MSSPLSLSSSSSLSATSTRKRSRRTMSDSSESGSTKQKSSSSSRTKHQNNIQQDTTASSAGSSNTTNQHYDGFCFINENLRSILYRPIGLPLVAAFYGVVLPAIPSYPVEAFPQVMGSGSTEGDDILTKVYVVNMDEPSLTASLKTEIHKSFSDRLHVETESRILAPDARRTDLLFLSKPEKGTVPTESRSTPLCLVEVGLSSKDWWKKFDQGKSYLDIMRRTQRTLQYCFDEPLLMAIITLDDSNNNFEFQMGVFLCTSRKKEENFRM